MNGRTRPQGPGSETAAKQVTSTVRQSTDNSRTDALGLSPAQAKKLRARWRRLVRIIAEIETLNPEHVSAVLDDLDYSLASGLLRDVSRFLDRVGEHRRPGLRAVGGDK